MLRNLILEHRGVWLFDEGKGNITEDLTGNGNNGTLMNDTEWVDGKFG